MIRLSSALTPGLSSTTGIIPVRPLTSFQTLGERWGHSKPTVSRLLKKLEKMNLITLVSFRGNHGSMIYLNNYLSIMFNISDVLIDKEEIAMKMKLPIYIPKEAPAEETENQRLCAYQKQ